MSLFNQPRPRVDLRVRVVVSDYAPDDPVRGQLSSRSPGQLENPILHIDGFRVGATAGVTDPEWGWPCPDIRLELDPATEFATDWGRQEAQALVDQWNKEASHARGLSTIGSFVQSGEPGARVLIDVGDGEKVPGMIELGFLGFDGITCHDGLGLRLEGWKRSCGIFEVTPLGRQAWQLKVERDPNDRGSTSELIFRAWSEQADHERRRPEREAAAEAAELDARQCPALHPETGLRCVYERDHRDVAPFGPASSMPHRSGDLVWEYFCGSRLGLQWCHLWPGHEGEHLSGGVRFNDEDVRDYRPPQRCRAIAPGVENAPRCGDDAEGHPGQHYAPIPGGRGQYFWSDGDQKAHAHIHPR